VTIVVPVLMISCQVSEYANAGPVAAQTTMAAQATTKLDARPHCRDIHCAAAPNAALTANRRFFSVAGCSPILLPALFDTAMVRTP
jgi:hypothetical protein